MQDDEELGATCHTPLQRSLDATAVAAVALVVHSEVVGPFQQGFDFFPCAISARVVDKQQTIIQTLGQPLPWNAIDCGANEALSVVTRHEHDAGAHLVVLSLCE